jgi:hypothetical protein
MDLRPQIVSAEPVAAGPAADCGPTAQAPAVSPDTMGVPEGSCEATALPDDSTEALEGPRTEEG